MKAQPAMAGGQGLGLVFSGRVPKEQSPGLRLICSDLCIQKIEDWTMLDAIRLNRLCPGLVVYQSGMCKPVYSREPSQTAEFNLNSNG